MATITDISYLKVFCTTVECCSIKKAAILLSTTPSTISKKISHLEKNLSMKLFEQDGRGIKSTKEGFKFYKTAKQCIESIDSLFVNFTDTVKAEKNRVVRIAYHFSLGDLFLPELIKKIHTVIKDPIISISETDYDTAMNGLIKNDYDIGLYILEENVVKNERLIYNKIQDIEYEVVINKNNPLSKKGEISIHDLQSERMLFMDRTNISASSLLSWMKINGISSYMQMTNVKWNTIVAMVALDLGVTIIANFYKNCTSQNNQDLVVFKKLNYKHYPKISICLIQSSDFFQVL